MPPASLHEVDVHRREELPEHETVTCVVPAAATMASRHGTARGRPPRSENGVRLARRRLEPDAVGRRVLRAPERRELQPTHGRRAPNARLVPKQERGEVGDDVREQHVPRLGRDGARVRPIVAPGRLPGVSLVEPDQQRMRRAVGGLRARVVDGGPRRHEEERDEGRGFIVMASV